MSLMSFSVAQKPQKQVFQNFLLIFYQGDWSKKEFQKTSFSVVTWYSEKAVLPRPSSNNKGEILIQDYRLRMLH
jgi:carotenoid cleavage dioxygenase-like enzyme